MDLRVQKTYRALKNSFTELMEEKKYEDITVGLLCERAMIRRTTFYKHFSDKNDFFNFYMSQVHDDFRNEFVSDGEYKDMYESEVEMIDYLMKFLSSHNKLVENILSSNALDNMMWAFSDFIGDTIADNIAQDEDLVQELGDEIQVLSAFVAGGIVKLVMQWWSEGHTDEGREKVLEMLKSLHEKYQVVLSESSE